MSNASVFHQLRDKWSSRHQALQVNLWTKHKDALSWLNNNTKQLAAGSLGSLILLTQPPVYPLLQAPVEPSFVAEPIDKKVFLIADLAKILPATIQPLTTDEEKQISDVLTRNFGVPITAELNGKRLNRSYGLIGAEQHLMRYPGDTMESHFDTAEEVAKYYSSGMAPNQGAWGYFATSPTELTETDKLREKYYLAVQTFLIPDYNEHVAEYRDFLRFRKMIAVNPQNGKAVVTVIGDSGPAEWTGKHLGGSPEVMKYLERVDGRARGPVLYFFIDDPENKIPLGPIEIR